MKKSSYKVLGAMSGTSLDGLDLAIINFKKEKDWNFAIEKATTIPYSNYWKNLLSKAIELPDKELEELNIEYTNYLALSINNFLNINKPISLDAICSHGHTVKHQPQDNYTLQIGNLSQLADLTGYTIVCDFRIQDVQLGGQGAPLVPIGDELLFPQYTYCLNLGGFANISTRINTQRIAYDICAVNTVLNFYAEKLGFDYDEFGNIARSGSFNHDLFLKLEQLDFYKKSYPKSLGIEWVKSEVFPVLSKFEKDIPSVLHTYVHHIASQISKNLSQKSSDSVLITGGGAFNNYLIEVLESYTSLKIILPKKEIINFKEALIFGFLGVLKLRDEINVLSSVTGASRDHSAGIIFKPKK